MRGWLADEDRERTARVIEVSIYKWTRSPIFYITQSSKHELLPPKRSYSVYMYLMIASRKGSQRRGEKIKWRRSLAIKKSFDAIYGYPRSVDLVHEK